MLPTSIESLRQPGFQLSSFLRPWRTNTRVKLALWGVIVVFAIYRLATFMPEPLDGPHTLRPVLNAWFDKFLRMYRTPEAAYETWRTLSLFALMIAPTLAILNYVREHGKPRVSNRWTEFFFSRALFFVSIASTLFLCRFPTLVAYALNPDEGQFISAAHKLFYYPNFFAALDSGTSGPLNIFPLMLPAIFGISPDYTSSRVIALAVALCSIVLAYKTVRLLCSDAIARLSILPFAGGIAIFENPNLIHYSSEQIPVLLIAIAFYVATRVIRTPAKHAKELLLLGFLVSAGFFAKMQSVPILGLIGVVALAYTAATNTLRAMYQPALMFLAGIFSLQILNAAMCLRAGVWKDFVMSYIITNQRYTDRGGSFVSDSPNFFSFIVSTPEVGFFLFTAIATYAAYTLQRFRSNGLVRRNDYLFMTLASAAVMNWLIIKGLRAPSHYASSYLFLTAIFVILTSFLLIYEKGSFGVDRVRWFGLLSVVSTAATIFCIYRPHRYFPHYLYLLFPSVTALTAWMLMKQNRESAVANELVEQPPMVRLAFPLLFGVLALSFPVFLWGSQPPRSFRAMVQDVIQPEGDFIRSLVSPRGQIFVWGWTPDPYLSSGHTPATRDLNLFYQFEAPPDVTAYYRDRLFRDLKRNPPELIIDAIGPSNYAFADRLHYGMQHVPDVENFVKTKYRHVADAYGQKFYLRADLPSRSASVLPPKDCSPRALRCDSSPRRDYSEGRPPKMPPLPPIDLPAHALIEVQFTPFGRQAPDATILNNEAVARSVKGFRFQNIGGDLYRLVLGLGDQWAVSQPMLIPDGKPTWLSIEFVGEQVRIQLNGSLADTMRLPHRMADAPGPITVGSWLNGECQFSGTIQFFQIVDLDAR